IVDKIIDSGDKKSSIWINGVRVDCYIFTPENYESGIMHLTGSAEHNKQLRIIAKSKGLTLSQYGLFRQDSNIRLDNGTEQDIYNKLGYEWIPPEHREGTIEFDTYKIHIIPPSGNISNISYGHSHTPILLKHEDIISDFHIHSNWSDGKNSIESIVVHALSLGLKTIAITDHSQSLKIAHGLSIDRLLEQQQEINRCKQKFPQINILSGSEVDIKSDGTLDYPDHILNNLDIVIGSIHTATKQNVTNIYIKAIESGKLSIIGHITGRLINERMPHDMDIETILQTCKQYNVAIELNCQPNRLDADEQILKRCKHLDIKIALGSDAHDLSQIKYVQSYGLWTAKRAWITKHDLLDIKNIHLGNHP
ncbi:MAG: PHP domain-containing protein, partial [bacterium]|nr:PHP domain-containing protein [bacterium]